MGAASSVLVGQSIKNKNGDSFTDEIINMVHCITVFKEKIALSDATLVNKELKKQYVKDHKLLILSLTSRTKAQLHSMFIKCNFGDTGYMTINNLSQGALGLFFQNLVSSRSQVEYRAIKIAGSGIGCDESAILEIFGCMSNNDFINLNDQFKFHEKDGSTLIQLIDKKIKKTSELYNFFTRILKCERMEGSFVDKELAATQAAALHAAGASRTFGMDIDVILDILCTSSRAQCEEINLEYIKQFKMCLDNAIKKKFSSSCAQALVLWCHWEVTAVAMVLHNASGMIGDANSIANTLPKYDKDFLNEVKIVVKKIYNSNLFDMISNSRGNFDRAVKGWLFNQSPDRGYEIQLTTYINQYLNQFTVEDMMKENHIYQKILTLLEMQLDALKNFFGTDYTKLDFTLTSKEHIGFIINSMGQSYRIPLGDIQINPDIWVGLDTNTPGYAGNLLDSSIKIHTNRGYPSTDTDPEMHTNSSKSDISIKFDHPKENSIETEISIPQRKSSRQKSFHRESFNNDDYGYDQEKDDTFHEYINEKLQAVDYECSGHIPGTLFWDTVAGMSLELIGINGEALAIMRECFDWEKEGYIFYTGTIVEELSDVIVNSIEEQGLYTVAEALLLVTSNPDHSLHTQEHQIPDIENLPPDLLQYFRDTYDQCDIDKNGVLDKTEFLNLISSLDLGLCGTDLDDIQAEFDKWDTNHTGDVDWEEAALKFDNIIHGLASSERDHWICLFDKTHQLPFWYNVRDRSSSWTNIGPVKPVNPVDPVVP
mmetsp:Transcript_2765/g.2898  ORF Transcript_2765/g.2898 Transcript_2765/m.2898 type:complete len:767 (-) Transcript_2765:452-2752(-)